MNLEYLIDDFESMTSYPLRRLLENYKLFVDYYFQDVVNWYSGQSNKPNSKAFSALNNLLRESKNASDVFFINRNRLITCDWWELADILEDIWINLESISNVSKYFRSVITQNQFNKNIEIQQHLKQKQTLESLAEEVGYQDKINDWSNIALRNDLIEEDYTSDGGNFLNISYQIALEINVYDVFDNLNSDNLYGKDVYKILTFEDNDLKVLEYKDTMTQACEILLNLRKGQNPEFSDHGISSDIVVGSNRSNIQYPVLMRQLFATFSNDDTISFIQVKDLKREGDSLFVTLDILTKKDEVITNSTLI